LSRIGKQPISIPKGVTVTVNDGKVGVKGPKGSLTRAIISPVNVAVSGDVVQCTVPTMDRMSKQAWGLMRVLIRNMIVGVTDGYKKLLDIHGVGYKAEAKGKDLNITVGFSHQIIIKAEDGITLKPDTPTRISIEGIDKETVGRIASEMRKLRPPEPYKGKGIHYAGERIRRKVGKAAGK
jgi:large subunit ribosomal protein L6